MPIDYSKWKNIEVSDDEDDTHPNIDTPSLFRWRHQARLERMAQQHKDKEEIQTVLTKTQQELQALEVRLKEDQTMSEEERKKIRDHLDKAKKEQEEWKKKEEEMARSERIAPWNVDTIAHEGFSKSRINKVKPTPTSEPENEEEKSARMTKFFNENSKMMDHFAVLRKFDDSKQYLLDNPHLCCEDTANYLTLECLNMEMEGKHELMEHMSHQVIVMNFLLELAKELKYSAQAPQLISMFFDKLKKAEKMYQDTFEDELKSFRDRIKTRAKQKLEEMMEKYEEEERQKRLGPGGLDPIEVLESLPESMRKCFEDRDIGRLQLIASEMPEEEFRQHLKRCVDSGLWLPDGGKKEADQVPSTEDDVEVPSK